MTTDEEILKEYDEKLDRLSYHRTDKLIPDCDVLDLMSLARQEGEVAGREKQEGKCEKHIAGWMERIASLEKQVEINEQTIQTYEQEKKRDRERIVSLEAQLKEQSVLWEELLERDAKHVDKIASLEAALSQRGNVVNIATNEQVEYVQKLEQQLKEAKDELKKWDDGVIHPACANYQEQIKKLQEQLKAAKQDALIVSESEDLTTTITEIKEKARLEGEAASKEQIAALTATNDMLMDTLDTDDKHFEFLNKMVDALEKQNKILADALIKLRQKKNSCGCPSGQECYRCIGKEERRRVINKALHDAENCGSADGIGCEAQQATRQSDARNAGIARQPHSKAESDASEPKEKR